MDARVTELHCIMPIANIPLVLEHGILSYERAAKLPHHSVAMQPVQERRDQKQVPGGLRLHQYANLYFHARNPMLFKRLNEAASLSVLRVSVDVLAQQGTVITDQNAASDWVRFLDVAQWRNLPFDDIFAGSWTDPDQVTYWRKKSRKCAEVLVPHQVETRFLMGAYVVDAVAANLLMAQGFGLPVTTNPAIFFRDTSGA
jgi:hypothetical protein